MKSLIVLLTLSLPVAANAECRMKNLSITRVGSHNVQVTYDLYGCTRNQRNLIDFNLMQAIQKRLPQITQLSSDANTWLKPRQ